MAKIIGLLFPLVFLGVGFVEAAKPVETKIAVFPFLQRGKTEAKTVEGLAAALVSKTNNFGGVRVIKTAELRSRLRSDPQKAVERCGASLTCLTGIGRKVAAAELFIGRASRVKSGLEVVVLRFSVEKKKIVGTAKLVIDPQEPLDASAEKIILELTSSEPLGKTQAKGEDGSDKPESSASSGEELPLALLPQVSNGSAPGTSGSSGPGPLSSDKSQPSVSSGVPGSVSSESQASPSSGVEANASSAAFGEQADVELALPTTFMGSSSQTGATNHLTPPESQPWWFAQRYLFFGGLGVIGVGAACLATGLGFGIASKSDWSKIEPNSRMTQVRADNLADKSNQRAGQANTWFVVGSAALTIGAGLWGLDLGLFGSLYESKGAEP